MSNSDTNTKGQNNNKDISDLIKKPQDLEKLEKEAEKERSRKAGSQTNSSDQHNNGRGGGK